VRHQRFTVGDSAACGVAAAGRRASRSVGLDTHARQPWRSRVGSLRACSVWYTQIKFLQRAHRTEPLLPTTNPVKTADTPLRHPHHDVNAAKPGQN
jgi:hypothetical protein